MRHIRQISEEEAGFRYVGIPGLPGAITSKYNSVEPEPVGTLVLLPYRIVGYTPDCNGQLLAQLSHVWDENGTTNEAIDLDRYGLTGAMVIELDELKQFF